MKIAAIDHLVLRTSRLEQMLDFYCRVLGCSVERETGPELGLVQLRAGDALIDLVTVGIVRAVVDRNQMALLTRFTRYVLISIRETVIIGITGITEG